MAVQSLKCESCALTFDLEVHPLFDGAKTINWPACPVCGGTVDPVSATDASDPADVEAVVEKPSFISKLFKGNNA